MDECNKLMPILLCNPHPEIRAGISGPKLGTGAPCPEVLDVLYGLPDLAQHLALRLRAGAPQAGYKSWEKT